MPEISLFNSAGRDAQVMAQSVRVPVRLRWLDGEDRQVTSTRLLRGTINLDYDALLAKAGSPEKIAELLVAGDPEIDMESVGSYLRDTSRVYINSDKQVVHSVTQAEIVRNPDGTEKLRRPKQVPPVNVTPEQPLPWSGKMIAKKDAFNKFVMVSKLQILHINGLTYDFLFGIAKELEAKKSLLIVGGGPKANQPLILRRGSVPYRGFMEGRTQGEDYCLILHLSNMELKAPDAASSTAVEKPS